MSATVTSPLAATANAPLPFPLEIVNPALVAESPVDANVPTAPSLARFSAIVNEVAVISIAWSVTEIVTVSESALLPSVARMVRV